MSSNFGYRYSLFSGRRIIHVIRSYLFLQHKSLQNFLSSYYLFRALRNFPVLLALIMKTNWDCEIE